MLPTGGAGGGDARGGRGVRVAAPGAAGEQQRPTRHTGRSHTRPDMGITPLSGRYVLSRAAARPPTAVPGRRPRSPAGRRRPGGPAVEGQQQIARRADRRRRRAGPRPGRRGPPRRRSRPGSASRPALVRDQRDPGGGVRPAVHRTETDMEEFVDSVHRQPDGSGSARPPRPGRPGRAPRPPAPGAGPPRPLSPRCPTPPTRSSTPRPPRRAQRVEQHRRGVRRPGASADSHRPARVPAGRPSSAGGRARTGRDRGRPETLHRRHAPADRHRPVRAAGIRASAGPPPRPAGGGPLLDQSSHSSNRRGPAGEVVRLGPL